MANFNWFSRRFDQASKADTPAETTEDTAANKEEPAAQKADSAPAMSPEDYLAWAKAAYQNVQKQQAIPSEASSQSEPAVIEESVTAVDPEVTSPDLAPSESSIAESPEAKIDEIPPPAALESVSEAILPAVESATTEAAPPTIPSEAEPPPVAATSIDPLSEVVDEPPVANLSEATEPISESPPSESTTSAGPAWMQSAAERQARLERLQETAIADPDPDPDPEPDSGATTLEAPVLPDINFDEAFLWSAGVLAAQGRQAEDISIEEINWLNRLRQGLDKTRRSLVNQLKAIVGQGPLNEDAVFEIEALLLQADVGVEATDIIIEALQAKLREEALPPEQAIAYLKKILRDMLDAPLGESHNLEFVPEKETFNIWLMTGVNGAGKTTTIGKLAHIAKKSGYSCLIGAADTFRAAAVEQVKAWGARSDVDVIANPGKNTDPAAVVFDAITAAQSRECELLLVDTAGRLQNKKNLMEELSKIRRIIDKKAPDAKVESLLVLDATLGQNGLQQAKVFSEAANLSGVVLTKLDGTARGGVALAVAQQLGLPIRFIGAGEGIEDLRPFSSYEFVEALLSG